MQPPSHNREVAAGLRWTERGIGDDGAPMTAASAALPGRRLADLAPAVATTFMVGCVFAALKFVLIGRIALDWDPTVPGALDALPSQWLREVTLAAHHRGNLGEAISQAMAVVLTFGLIVGFPLNGPLAGAWRCDRLFAVSTALVGVGCMMALWSNPWLWAGLIGIAYGAACAARGKIVPLLACSTGHSATLISGAVNAALAIGLIAGTIIGSFASQELRSPLHQHLLLLMLAAIGVATALAIRVPEPPSVPYREGLRAFASATALLFRRHWALLMGGGLAWGITAAASLALFVHAVDELHLPRGLASTLAACAALGAIVGNLSSHRYARRRHVIAAFVVLAATLAAYPWLVTGMATSAVLVFVIGFCFAAPANVLDARFLRLAHDEGLAGLGGTVMSFTHSVAILVIGLGLALPLFLGLVAAHDQFWVLAGIALASCACAAGAQLRDAQK
jgi:hypothetical protein